MGFLQEDRLWLHRLPGSPWGLFSLFNLSLTVNKIWKSLKFWDNTSDFDLVQKATPIQCVRVEQITGKSWRALPQSRSFQPLLSMWTPMLSLPGSQKDTIFSAHRKSFLYLPLKGNYGQCCSLKSAARRLFKCLPHFSIAPQWNFTWVAFSMPDGLTGNYNCKGIRCVSHLQICFAVLVVLILTCLWECNFSLLLPLTSWRSAHIQLLQASCSQGSKTSAQPSAGQGFLAKHPALIIFTLQMKQSKKPEKICTKKRQQKCCKMVPVCEIRECLVPLASVTPC